MTSPDYESETLLHWYLLFHYGSPEQILAGSAFSEKDLPAGCLEFPAATVRAFQSTKTVSRALDIGCAVGRSTFELSKFVDEVVGIDYSSEFVRAASEIQREDPVSVRRFSEGHLREIIEVRLPTGVHPDRVRFETGDAMKLPDSLGSFDLVLAANLLCRLSDPGLFLNSLPTLVRPGGRAVIATPATWMSDFTSTEEMPPGKTLDFLKEHLSPGFKLVSVSELPFFIREHQRKFQLSTSQASLWIRCADS